MKPATHAHWKSAKRSVQVPLFSHGVEAQSSISKKGELKLIGVKTRHAHIVYVVFQHLFTIKDFHAFSKLK